MLMKNDFTKYESILCDTQFKRDNLNQDYAFLTWAEYFEPNKFIRDSHGFGDMERSSVINGSLSCFCDETYEQKGMGAMFEKYQSDSTIKNSLSYKIC